MHDGFFAYGLMQDTSPTCLRIFPFVTSEPACGDGFFDANEVLTVVSVFDLPATFVNCGKVSIHALSLLPEPKFYETKPPVYKTVNHHDPVLPGVTYVYVDRPVTDTRGYVMERITQEAAIAEGRFKEDMITCLSYERLFQEWRPKMEMRDVPPEFLDREAMRKMAAGEPVMEKPLPRQEVELVVIIPVQGDDPALDEPEEQFEEPLSEALEEAECGSCTSSGTTPDSFDIDVDTVKPSLRRCLSVIRRVLTKAGAPAGTIIRQLPDDPNDPPIDHPLEAPPPAPKKAARK